MKKIIRDNVTVKQSNNRLRIIIYYKNLKSCNLVMRNNLGKKPERLLSKCSLVYQFTCPEDECIHSISRQCYVGQTVCSLSRRLSNHLQNGAIKEHFDIVHHKKITRKVLEDNTIIRYVERDRQRLLLLEALIILLERPVLNQQFTGMNRVLTLFK